MADIEACAIAIDPSYGNYVEQMTTVMRTGAGVERVEWEVLFHATNDEPRNRWYRVLAAAIGALHPMLGDLVSPTQVAVSLVEDAVALADAGLTTRVEAALRELAEQLAQDEDSDAPFVWLAALLVAAVAGHAEAELSALAVRVFDEEARFAREASRGTFLWRCARSKLDRKRWTRAIEQHLPPSTQSLASLRTAILRTLTAVK